MRKYCKAYYLHDLRQFSGWIDNCKDNKLALQEDTIVYLCDDLTVVNSPIGSSTIFDQVSAAWQQFCRETLGFTIPEDLRYMYEDEYIPH